MPATTPSRECPICLDKLRDPVVTPCGHLACHQCIKTHARGCDDPYKATCPTCRAPFPIVTPDMSIVPTKYHVFISPPLRRVFLGDGDDPSKEVIENLEAEVAALKVRVVSLKRDKALLMDRCDAAQFALTRLTADERAARLARDEAREDARVAKQNLKNLRKDDDARNCRCAGEQSSRMATLAKRTSGHAELDDSSSSTESDWFDRGPGPLLRSALRRKYPNDGRPVKPMPKRAKVGPARAAAASSSSLEPNVQPSSGNATSRTLLSTDSSSSESESSLEPPLRFSRRLRSAERALRSRNASNVHHGDSNSDNESDSRDERGNMQGSLTALLLHSPIRNTRNVPLLPSEFSRGPGRSDRLRTVRVSRSTSEIPSEPTIVPGE